MNWYEGTISEAISFSKERNAIFVVYIEGKLRGLPRSLVGRKDGNDQKLETFLKNERICKRLSSEEFVGIKIHCDSEAYLQFVAIYQVVPVPSIFFIGRSGTPLEIGTEAIESVEEFERKIDKVVQLNAPTSASFNLSQATGAHSTSFLAAAQHAAKHAAALNVYCNDTSSSGSGEYTGDRGRINENFLETEKLVESINSSPGGNNYEAVSDSEGNTNNKMSDYNKKNEADVKEPNSSTKNEEPVKEEVEYFCDDDVCYLRPKAKKNNEEQKSDNEQTTAVEPDMEYDLPAPMPTATVSEIEFFTENKDEFENEQDERDEQDEQDEDAKSETSKRLDEARQLLEQKRSERIKLEQKAEQERELRRRREGKEAQNMQQWQREQDLKQLKDDIRRERLEEQVARERILAKIAADKAERAERFDVRPEQQSIGIATVNVSPTVTKSSQTELSSNMIDSARIQFRMFDGNSRIQRFDAMNTLGQVRQFVQDELLAGTGIRDFSLATTYPKRELTIADDDKTLLELQLMPSAVILVLQQEKKSATSAVMKSSANLYNLLGIFVNLLLSPVYALYGVVSNWRSGGGNASGAVGNVIGSGISPSTDLGAARLQNVHRNEAESLKHSAESNEESTKVSGTSGTAHSNNKKPKPYRRVGTSNIHRLSDRKESDDENATWNGNSTQQQ